MSKRVIRGTRRLRLPRGAQQLARRNRRDIIRLSKDKENKYIDTQINETVAIAGNAAQLELLNGLIQGNTNTTRQGVKVRFTRLSYRITAKSTGAETGWVGRMMIVYDRKPAGAAQAMATILEANSVHGLLNKDSLGRFKVLLDKMITFPSVERVRTFKGSIPLKSLAGDYRLGNAGDITDLFTGSIYFFCNTIYNAATVDFDGNVRITFKDD